MNIEISNEQIEQMVEKAVDKRVKTWFEEPRNKYFIRDAIIKAVNVEVSKRVDDSMDDSMIDIPKLASSLASKKLAEEITDNIGYNIASIFAEKYGD